MALKFLNKKGWHTGSLRNIENVWKAEQKHDAEQRKLEELRKQIHEERERDEFRLLQEQAGITPRQERLEFLYDSGLSVGKPSSDGFTALEAFPRSDVDKPSTSASQSAPSAVPDDSSKSAVPGALFEEKPQSANDAWRKLHSDPLLMIRQREQEALARIKNNPVKMAMIRKSVESKKDGDEASNGKHQKVKSKHRKHSSSKYHSDSENDSDGEKERRKKSKHKKKQHLDSDDSGGEKERRNKAKHKNKARLDSEDDSRERTSQHRHSYREYGSEDHRRSSPMKQNADRRKDSRDDKPRQHRRSELEYGSDKQQRNSPSKQRTDKSYANHKNKDRLDSDEDSRGKTRHHSDSHREYGSENHRRCSPVRQKADRREDSRDDKPRHHRHSQGEYESDKQQHVSLVKQRTDKSYETSKYEDYPRDHLKDKAINSHRPSDSNYSAVPPRPDSYKRRGRGPQLSEEERAARLREMQMDAEVHEEQRWKRLKKADEDDAREASQAGAIKGRSFLDSVHKSVYGAEKGGSTTIEESVRRRAHFLQGKTAGDERNAFRR